MSTSVGAQREAIATGRTALGIELGSTRIKAALIGPDTEVLATGTYDWENQFVDRMWTYPLPQVWEGLAGCFASLAGEVREQHGVELTTVGSLGVSAMMHGYLAFDATGELLVPFRTWRNTTTGPASDLLTPAFDFHVPLRWSVAHLCQAILDDEPHVGRVAFITTLAGYVHWQLTGEKVLGVGDASGMFPIDSATNDFDRRRLAKFDALMADRNLGWRLADILPKVLVAGEPAGKLTPAGARLLDPSGTLRAGVPMCPPEGDAGTGMVATNAVTPRTGNVSVGTSIFAMVVLEHALSKVHPEIDMVTTPAGDPVAMVHCNNGASEIDQWCSLFGEFAAAAGVGVSRADAFGALYRQALAGEPDGGGLVAYNFVAGEDIAGLTEGRPMVLRTPESRLSLANFMRVQIYAMFATLKLGMDVLAGEHVSVDRMLAQGGVFTTPEVAQRMLAAAIDTPIIVPATAPQGGAWGMAVLAAYLADDTSGLSLADYLEKVVFTAQTATTIEPGADDVAGFAAFMRRFTSALAAERAAVETI